ncbi:hydroxypyruvate isomerase family protein [Flavisolibacter ginsenosidimutans]|uniref:TIM barrel protein n=2 Tax=Flavisolibacter ginsenosidimutans TaxID=661481 RepID=A0A5B8UG52_9BACT|nr:TIM barrel protein [Flavisolibacter ginsenosidimutans]
MERRGMIKNLLLTGTAVAASPVISLAGSDVVTAKEEKLKGNINHSVCQWTYNFLPLDELCRAVKKIGFSAIDLVGPKDWPTLQKNGIFSSMCYTAGENSLTKGWNDPSQHARLIKDFTEAIPLVAKAGYKNVITFSGNRAGMDDETGLKNCVTGLKQIMSLAEKNGVMVQMELLNSKVNHKDYMCDKTPWGVELCKRLGSPNFKLLYDIYHMQIDEGDVIRTIQDNHEYIGHYHTGGVPGRHEIDDSQELYYPAIMKAILATGFKDYVAQEFIPTGKDNGDKIASLKNAIKICDV